MNVPRVSPRTFHRLTVVAVGLVALTIVTGAAVRLTGSGLGCDTWPRCTSTSIVAPASFHGAVEFGNRVLSTVIGACIGAVAVAALLRSGRRRDLTLLAWSLVAGFFAQAVVGGLSVLYDLAPQWVMAHFLLSMLMLWAALVLAHRSHPGWVPAPPAGRRELVLLGRLLVAAAGLVLLLGTLTTATGPHSGGGERHVTRLGLPLERVTQLHADAALFLTGLIVAMVFAVRVTEVSDVVRRRSLLLVAAVGIQVTIGYVQYFLGVPAGIVELHVLGATLLWASALWLQLGFTAPSRQRERDVAVEELEAQPLVEGAGVRRGV